MSTVLPEGEQIRKAVRWISNVRVEYPERNLRDLVEDAQLRFDLSPKDARTVEDFFLRRQ